MVVKEMSGQNLGPNDQTAKTPKAGKPCRTSLVANCDHGMTESDRFLGTPHVSMVLNPDINII